VRLKSKVYRGDYLDILATTDGTTESLVMAVNLGSTRILPDTGVKGGGKGTPAIEKIADPRSKRGGGTSWGNWRCMVGEKRFPFVPRLITAKEELGGFTDL